MQNHECNFRHGHVSTVERVHAVYPKNAFLELVYLLLLAVLEKIAEILNLLTHFPQKHLETVVLIALAEMVKVKVHDFKQRLLRERAFKNLLDILLGKLYLSCLGVGEQVYAEHVTVVPDGSIEMRVEGLTRLV